MQLTDQVNTPQILSIYLCLSAKWGSPPWLLYFQKFGQGNVFWSKLLLEKKHWYIKETCNAVTELIKSNDKPELKNIVHHNNHFSLNRCANTLSWGLKHIIILSDKKYKVGNPIKFESKDLDLLDVRTFLRDLLFELPNLNTLYE